jgi:hypothetical protein
MRSALFYISKPIEEVVCPSLYEQHRKTQL